MISTHYNLIVLKILTCIIRCASWGPLRKTCFCQVCCPVFLPPVESPAERLQEPPVETPRGECSLPKVQNNNLEVAKTVAEGGYNSCRCHIWFPCFWLMCELLVQKTERRWDSKRPVLARSGSTASWQPSGAWTPLFGMPLGDIWVSVD